MQQQQPFSNNQLPQETIEQNQQNSEQVLQDKLRVIAHWGRKFFLGSEFYVQVEWGNELVRTRKVKDKINPLWSESLKLIGSSKQHIQIRVCDNRKNILESFRLSFNNLRACYPYHLKLIFKEEFMGATPEIYITLIRQSSPHYAINQRIIEFGVKNIGDSLKNPCYLLLSMKSEPIIPKFLEIDLKEYQNLSYLNKFIEKVQGSDERRLEFVPLEYEKDTFFTILKSFMSRKMYVFLIAIIDFKSYFVDSNANGCKIIEKKGEFQKILRKVYYHEQTFTFKRYLQLFNPVHQIQALEEATNADRWRILSNNYLLRYEVANISKKNIQEVRSAIEKKGKHLVELKKVLAEVKSVNLSLTQKQKSLNHAINRQKKQAYNPKDFTANQLIATLLQKQAELTYRKKLNQELQLRMNCLTDMTEDNVSIESQLIANAKILLEQQQKIRKMKEIEALIPKQRDIIGQLESIFQKRQIDKRLNDILAEQNEKLKQIRESKQNKLKAVYDLVKNNSKTGSSLLAKVRLAEQTLIKLNQQYAKLKTF